MPDQHDTSNAPVQAVSLDDLARAINTAHANLVGDLIEHSIHCGELLWQAQKVVGRGHFIPWVEKNCRFGVRMAQRYLQLWERRDEVRANATRVSQFSIRGALQDLRKAKKPGEKPRISNLTQARQRIAELEDDLKRAKKRDEGAPPTALFTARDAPFEIARVIRGTLPEPKLRKVIEALIQMLLDDGDITSATAKKIEARLGGAAP